MLVHQEQSKAQNLRGLLGREHTQLESLFQRLLAAVESDARPEAAKLWSEFDARLLGHLQLEEEQLLPSFERAHPSEAARIRSEHEQIRSMLIRLGIGLDLHVTRADVVEAFINLLRAHAAREDALMYAWSHEHLEPPARATVLERLLASVSMMPRAPSR